MASIKEYNRKLASLKNTVKITKTMKMVSASKLKRAQDKQNSAKDYAREVNNLIFRIAGAVEQSIHPLLEPKAEVKKVLLLVYTSDKGLCGGFNNNLIKFLRRQIMALEGEGKEVRLSHCGRRGHAAFQKTGKVFKNYPGVTALPSSRDATEIADELIEAFTGNEFDEVHIVYNRFQSAISQTPSVAQVLPLSLGDVAQHDADAKQAGADDFIAEPEMGALLSALIPKLVVFKIFYALLENSAGEHGARMSAMDAATGNASQMIDDYTLLRNRARQAAITTELIEIIAGAEAI
jgi:F-type H+-transporting ATPase subunit gamma